MQKLAFQFTSSIEFSSPVKDHSVLLRYVPREEPEQLVEAFELRVTPEAVALRRGTDAFGNTTLSGWYEAPHDRLACRCSGIVLRDDALRRPSAALPGYFYPSALTRPTAELADFARGLELVGSPRQKAGILQKAVHAHFSYEPGQTDIRTTAGEAFRSRRGVCQDYAHVFLSLARLSGVAARYVCGLPVGDGATHAWVDVWEDGFWYGYDPTRDCPAGEDYIRLAVGRDYNDCPPEKGIFSGCARQVQACYMEVRRLPFAK